MKYTKAFEIAELATQDMQQRGWRFKPDVLRTAALAAAAAKTYDTAVDALENAIEGARISVNPRWDGSIA